MMPTYAITIGAITTEVVQPGGDNAGQRRAAFISAANALGIARQHGVHGQMVPDATDASAREVRVPRGAGDAGAWEDTPAPKVQAVQAVAKGADSGIVARPGAGEEQTG